MGMYHDQNYVRAVVKAIAKEKEPEKTAIIDELRCQYAQSKIDLRKCQGYSAPEEIYRRKQICYYYSDILELLGAIKASQI